MDQLEQLAATAGDHLATMSTGERGAVLALLDVRVTVLSDSRQPDLAISGTVCDAVLLRNPAGEPPRFLQALDNAAVTY